MTDQLMRLEQVTGHQVVVATLPSLQGRPIERFALCLANHWGIGRKGINDGVVLLVAPKERRVRVEVGYGLERSLTDVEAETIIRIDVLPAFRRGDFAGGIGAAVNSIAREISGPANGSSR